MLVIFQRTLPANNPGFQPTKRPDSAKLNPKKNTLMPFTMCLGIGRLVAMMIFYRKYFMYFLFYVMDHALSL